MFIFSSGDYYAVLKITSLAAIFRGPTVPLVQAELFFCRISHSFLESILMFNDKIFFTDLQHFVKYARISSKVN